MHCIFAFSLKFYDILCIEILNEEIKNIYIQSCRHETLKKIRNLINNKKMFFE